MAWYQEDLTSLAFFWRLTRRDGVRLGFTSHDRDIWLDGLLYRAAPGMSPSAVEMNDGLEATGVDISGAITTALMTNADLHAGRWDGAQLHLSARDWAQLGEDPVFLAAGALGSIRMEDGRFVAELTGPEDGLEAPAGCETSPMCRASLGDKRCRVDMAGRRKMVQIVSLAGHDATVSATFADGDYAYGRLRWLSGANAGLDSWIDASAGNVLSLRSAPLFPVTYGTQVEITQGCDLRHETCVSRFGNAANFRGEPHLPGNDLLTRYAS